MRALDRLHVRPSILLVATAMLMSALAIGCSSESSPEPELVTADTALENALAAMSEVPQFEFELNHPEGKTSLDGGLDLRRAEGAVIAPDHLEVSAEADFGRLFVKVDAVVIEGATWMTNPLTRNWSEIAPEDSPFSFLDPIKLVTNVLAQTTEPVYPPEGGAISTDRIQLNGKVPSEALQPLVGTVLPGEVLDVELVLDRSNFRLVSALLTGRLQPGDESNYARQITFGGFDAELSIEPPI